MAYGLAGIYEAQIGHQRDHPDHHNGDPWDNLLLGVAPRVRKLCSCHGTYQESSFALRGWRLTLMLETFPSRSLMTRSAILAISGLWVIIMIVVP